MLIALAEDAGGVCLDIFLLYIFFTFLSPSLGNGPIKTEILSQRAVKTKITMVQHNFIGCMNQNS